MFNLSGSELIFLVIIALVVLGPDKLPEAMRKAGKAYADFKKMTTGFQSEMKSVLDEPMREIRETAELARQSAMFDTKPFTDSLKDLGNTVTKPVTKPVSGSMAAVTPAAAAPTLVEPVGPPKATPAGVAAGSMAAATDRSAPPIAPTAEPTTPTAQPTPTAEPTPTVDSVDGVASDTVVGADDAAARRLARATPPQISVSTTQVGYGATSAAATNGTAVANGSNHRAGEVFAVWPTEPAAAAALADTDEVTA